MPVLFPKNPRTAMGRRISDKVWYFIRPVVIIVSLVSAQVAYSAIQTKERLIQEVETYVAQHRKEHEAHDAFVERICPQLSWKKYKQYLEKH